MVEKELFNREAHFNLHKMSHKTGNDL